MILFLRKSILFLISLLIIGNILGSIAERAEAQDLWLSEAKKNFDAFNKNKATIEFLTVGNSHADAFGFENESIEEQSLARAGADMLEVAAFSQYIAGQGENLQKVFISVSYFSFEVDNAISRPILRINYYSMVPNLPTEMSQFKNWMLGKLQRVGRVMDVARPDSWQGVVRNKDNVLDFAQPQTDEKSSGFNCESPTEDRLIDMANGRYEKKLAEIETTYQSTPLIRQNSTASLRKGIEAFQENNIEVVLFTPPYTAPYNAVFKKNSPEIVEFMQTTIDQLSEEYDIVYLDFSDHPDFQNTFELFADSDHLNDCGKSKFYQAVFED